MDTETDLLPSIQNDGKTSDFFVILSVFSWIILVITCWMPILSLGISDNEIIMFVWLFKKRKENDEYYKEANNILDMNFAVFNVVIITTFILTTLGFLIYVGICTGVSPSLASVCGASPKVGCRPVTSIAEASACGLSM